MFPLKLDHFLDIADVIILVIGADQKVRLINRTGCQILGYKRIEIIGHNWFDLCIPARLRDEVKSVFAQLIGGKVQIAGHFENPVLCKNGKEKRIAWHNTVIRNDRGRIQASLSSGVDVTSYHQVLEALQSSADHYRILFEESPISLWEEDFSQVKRHFDRLRARGITDFRGYLETHPREVERCARLVQVMDVNRATLQLYHLRDIHDLRNGLGRIFSPDSYRAFREELIAMGEGKTHFETEAVNCNLAGDTLHIRLKWSVPAGYRDSLSKVFVSIVDLTRHVQAECAREKLYSELSTTHEKLKSISLLDAHTGLYNHRYFADIIKREFSQAKRYGRHLSVIMLDIDFFKSINDVYGHAFGDLVLKQFGHMLKKHARAYDTVVRFGGEEFIVVCPDQDRMQANLLAQTFHDLIGSASFGNRANQIKLKVSLAVASYPEDNICTETDFLQVVDSILSKSKEDGGDRLYSSEDLRVKKPRLPKDPARGGADDVHFLKQKLSKLTKQSHQSLIESIFAFARTIKLKDHYTGEHVESTMRYARSIAVRMGLPKEDVERVRQAAVLHDLGKIGIPERILMKKGKLTVREFDEIKKHPLIAADILRPVQFLQTLIPLILHHHERWDGRGYPFGLRGEEIPFGARIIALADTFQALISNRPYHAAYSEKEALKIITREAGTKFDPAVVKAFTEVFQREHVKSRRTRPARKRGDPEPE